MPSINVVATQAPEGKGTAAWDNGKLVGDPAILHEAQALHSVRLHPEEYPVKVDWSNPFHAAHALNLGAQAVYGEPVKVYRQGMPSPPTDVEESTATTG